MELTDKDIKAIAENRFFTKFIRSFQSYAILLLVILVTVSTRYFYDYYDDNKVSVIGYVSGDGQMLTLSTGYDNSIMQLVKSGEKIFSIHDGYMEYNGLRYDAKSSTVLNDNSFIKVIKDNILKIDIVMGLIIIGLIYFMYYRPLKKFREDFIREYKFEKLKQKIGDKFED